MCSKTEVRVGLSISLTGRFRLQGQQALQGIRLWQSYINAQSGIALRNGKRRSVRLIWYDDRSQISCARENVLRLLREDQINVLLGPYSSSLTMAVAEAAAEYSKGLWNHGGSSDEIFFHGRQYLVGIASPASDYLRGLPRWLAEEAPALRRICVLYSSRGTFGHQVARGIMESFRALGRQSVQLIPLHSVLENPATLLPMLLAFGAEVLVLVGRFQDDVTIMRTRHLWPNTVREVAAVASGIRAFSIELGPVAQGVIGPSQWEPGISFPNTVGPDSNWFLLNFEKQFGQPPEYIAAGSFATGLILTECIRRTGSLDDKDLRNAAAELDCNTLYGRFRIDSLTGIQTGHRILLTRWQEGCKVVLAARP